jgi:hypothetical protein
MYRAKIDYLSLSISLGADDWAIVRACKQGDILLLFQLAPG